MVFGMLEVRLACTFRPNTAKGLPKRCLCRAGPAFYCRRSSAVNSKDRRLPQSTTLEAFRVADRQRPLTSQAAALSGICCARVSRAVETAKREGTNDVLRENGIISVHLFLTFLGCAGGGDSLNNLSEFPCEKRQLGRWPFAPKEARPRTGTVQPVGG